MARYRRRRRRRITTYAKRVNVHNSARRRKAKRRSGVTTKKPVKKGRVVKKSGLAKRSVLVRKINRFLGPKAGIYVCLAVALIVMVTSYTACNAFKRRPSININNVSEFKAPYADVAELRKLSERMGIAFDELLTVYMLENRFFEKRGQASSAEALERLYIAGYSDIKKKYGDQVLRPYQDIYRQILLELKCFPAAGSITSTASHNDALSYTYMFGDGFTMSGKHYGIDIFSRENVPFGVLSATDGTVESMGESRQDGKYIVVRTDAGNHYYYTHLRTFADGVVNGGRVYAGQNLGQADGSGSGCDTPGMSIWLHFGLKVKTKDFGEIWINPYVFLRMIE